MSSKAESHELSTMPSNCSDGANGVAPCSPPTRGQVIARCLLLIAVQTSMLPSARRPTNTIENRKTQTSLPLQRYLVKVLESLSPGFLVLGWSTATSRPLDALNGVEYILSLRYPVYEIQGAHSTASWFAGALLGHRVGKCWCAVIHDSAGSDLHSSGALSCPK